MATKFSQWIGLASLLAILLLTTTYHSVRADTLVYTDTIPLQLIPWQKTLTFPKFDPTTGILTGVELTLSGQISGSVGYENTNPNSSSSIALQVNASLQLTQPNNSSLAAGGAIANFADTLPPFDGIPDFAGTSGLRRPFSVPITNTITFSSPGSLALFVGQTSITLPVRSASSFAAGGDTSNIIVQLRTAANAVGTMRYLYVVPQVELRKLTNGFDANSPNDADVPQIQPGGAVTWTYLLTNTGSITIPLASVVMTDSQPGVTPVRVISSDVNNDGLLGPGEVWRYQATATAENLDAPATPVTMVAGCNPTNQPAPGNRPTYRNIGQVTIPGGSDSDPSHYCNIAAPGIALIKLTNGFDANAPHGNDVPQLAPNAVVTWTYLVTNTGNITFALATVVVTDSQPGVMPAFDPTSDNGDNLLSPGEGWRYLATGIVQELTAPAPGVTVVSGCNPAGTPAPGNRPTYRNMGQVRVPGDSANDPSHYCNLPAPGIVLKKFTNNLDADDANGADVPQLAAGAVVTWSYLVSNTGNLTFTLAQVQVTDSNTGITPVFDPTSDNGDNLLSPGETWLYRATGVAQNLLLPTPGTTVVNGCDAANAGNRRATYENIGRVVALGATASDPSHYCNPLAPGIEIKKFTNGQDADSANGSDVPLLAASAAVTWSYRITNTGNITFALATVTVTDSQPGITPVLDAASDNGDGLLSPGEAWLYTATGTAQNLLLPSAGTTVVNGCDPANSGLTRRAYENVGTVQVRSLTVSDPSHYCNPPVPGIVIKKFTNGQDADNADGNDMPLIAPGATVTWTYIVTNTGNVPFAQADVKVTDSHSGVTPALDTTSDNGDGLLSPGEDWLYKATGTAQNLLKPTAGTTIVNGCDPANTTIKRPAYENIGRVQVNNLNASDPSHYCNPPVPGIAIKKYTNGQDADDANGRDVPSIDFIKAVTWTYVVSNTGNVPFTLAQVQVTDSQQGISPVLVVGSNNSDGILSPGEQWLYRATGIAFNLSIQNSLITVVDGCNPNGLPIKNSAYMNIGTVLVGTLTASDPSHYCNPKPTVVFGGDEPVGQSGSSRLFLPMIRR